MKIGITYDLREDYLNQGYSLEETAEFDSIETINAIAASLEKLGFEVERIGNIKQLINAISINKSWDVVFNIAEGLNGLAREAQVPALLDAFHIPYTFSDAATLALTLDKALTKSIVRDNGVATAPFTVIEIPQDCFRHSLIFPAFAKPIAEGTGKGITTASLITSDDELAKVCNQLLQTFKQPVLVESYLPGREFTVGIFGTGEDARVIGVMEIIMREKAEGEIYSFGNKEDYEDRVEYKVVTDTEAKQAADTALKAWKILRCRDAGRIDLRSDEHGIPQFLEVNPIAGLHPIRSDLIILLKLLGHDYDYCIQQIINSALKRLPQLKFSPACV